MLSSHPCTFAHTHTHILTMLTKPSLIPHSHTHSASSHNRCYIRFLLSRVYMRSMHYAVDHLDLDTIFPPTLSVSVNTEIPASIKRCLEELENSELYSSQKRSIVSMLVPAYRQVSILGYTHAKKPCAKQSRIFVVKLTD